MKLVLISGLDGTGDLFAPFVAALGEVDTQVISYPPDHAMDYAEHEAHVRSLLPREGEYVLLAESFSGPVGIAIAASNPPGLRGLILCCSAAGGSSRQGIHRRSEAGSVARQGNGCRSCPRLPGVAAAGVRPSAPAGHFPARSGNLMSKIEYKTILLPYKTGIFQDDSTDVVTALNKVGAEGWRLSQIVMPAAAWGRANTMVAILERVTA